MSKLFIKFQEQIIKVVDKVKFESQTNDYKKRGDTGNKNVETYGPLKIKLRS